MTAKLKALIYARTSRDDSDTPDGSKSIPEQVSDCEELCNRQGYVLQDVLKEPNCSGRLYPTGAGEIIKLDQTTAEYSRKLRKQTRDELGKLMALLPKIDVVVARDIERIARPN